MDQIFTSPNAFDFDNLRRDRAALDRDSLGEDLVTGAVSQGNGTVGVGRGQTPIDLSLILTLTRRYQPRYRQSRSQ